MAIWNRIQALVAGGAVATAASDGVRPVLEPVRQHAWTRNRLRVLDVDTTARLVAQAIIKMGEANDEAGRTGYSLNRLQALVKLVQTMPGQADLDRMLNRTTIGRELFNEALAKHQIDPRFWDALFDLTNDKLSVADIAAAVQQGHMPNDGILPDVSSAVSVAGGAVTPVAPDGQPPSSVPLTQIDIDPVAEAAADGYDLPRLKVRANLAGLPPGPETLLAMWNRGEIDEQTVDAGIREGHMKTKWAGAYKRFRWAVLSGQEYAEARLRDWITDAEMYRGGALTGHTKEQMDLFYKNRGRTATPRQVWLGWARKVPAPDYPGDPANGRLTGLKDHELAIRRSNIRPEYAKLLWDVRFNYPPIFQLTRLVQSDAITADQAKTWADYQLYAPEVTAALHAYWLTVGGAAGKAETKAEIMDEYAGGYISPDELRSILTDLGYTGATLEREIHLGDARRLKTLRERVVKAIADAYRAHVIDETAATSELAEVNVLGDAATMLIALWDKERRFTVRELSDAQVAKAGSHKIIDPAAALAELQSRGYSAEDAQHLIDLAP